MHPGRVHQTPRDDGDRDEDRPPPPRLPHQHGEERHRGKGGHQHDEVDLLGVERRDDDDPEQVVDHCERQQERPQGERETAAEDRENCESEGDVGGGGDRPAVQPVRVADRHHDDVTERGRDHATHRGRNGNTGEFEIPEAPGHELVFQFDSDDEEEDRQQPVGRPVRQRQM